MRVFHRLTFLEFFGYLALVLGIAIQAYALVSHPGSRISGDDMFGGAVVLCLAIAFIHSARPLLNLALVGLSGLGFGYFTFIHTQNWWWTVILAIVAMSFLVYLLDLRGDIRRQSTWFHF